MRTWRVFFCVVGALVSFYALHVEHMHNLDADYEALCDVSATMSCSKVLNSEYGKIFSHLGLFPKDSLFDQPNAFYGLVFYFLVGIMGSMSVRSPATLSLNLFLGIAGMVMTLGLAYILSFILGDVCLVCVSSYVCNTVILVDTVAEFMGTKKSRTD